MSLSPEDKQLLEDAYGALEVAQNELQKKEAQLEIDRRNLLKKLTGEITAILQPLLKDLPGLIREAIGNATIRMEVPKQPPPPPAQIRVTVPDVIVPEIKVPEAKVTVNVPPIKMPEVRIPEIKVPDVVMPDSMEVHGEVGLRGVSNRYPLPVVFMDPTTGEPITRFGGSFAQSQGPGNVARVVSIGEILTKAGVSMVDETNNALRVNIVTSSQGSSVVIGDVAHGAGENSDSFPVEIGGNAASTNHARVADGQRSRILTDLAGRQVTVDQQVRELITDNDVLLVRGAETTVLTQVNAVLLDILMISAANASANAVSIQFFESSAGKKRFTLEVPATDERGVVFKVPLGQTTAGRDWTAQVQGADISDSNVTVFMQAAKNT